MSIAFWHQFGRQLGHPEGSLGAGVGGLMALVNRIPNRETIRALNVAPSDSVLELGFGPGLAVARLSELAFRGEVHGVDHSSVMLRAARARNRAGSASGRVTLAHGRFNALPYGNHRFDKALAVNTAYFFGRTGAEMREVHRVLRYGGRFALYVTDPSSARHWKFTAGGTHRLYDQNDLADMAISAGFLARNIESFSVQLPLGMTGIIMTGTKSE